MADHNWMHLILDKSSNQGFSIVVAHTTGRACTRMQIAQPRNLTLVSTRVPLLIVAPKHARAVPVSGRA